MATHCEEKNFKNISPAFQMFCSNLTKTSGQMKILILYNL